MNSTGRIFSLSSQQRKETLREVYLVGGRYVIKRFIINKHAFFYPLPWLLESNALIQAKGLHVPEFVNLYAASGNSGMREFIMQRTLIPGCHMKGIIDAADVRDMADLLAKLHQRGIITRDATPRNFLKNPDGRMFLIDLGKARIHRTASFYDIGSEMARFAHSVLQYDEALWRHFVQRYYEIRPVGQVSKALEQFFYRLCKRNRMRRRSIAR